MTTTAPTIDEYGISAPTFAENLAYLQAGYQSIFGNDAYLGNDSQDGQLLAIFAAAMNDANSAIVAAYNAFSPSTAQGVGLSSVVKINGIARQAASSSTVDVLISGVVGTVISNGLVSGVGETWALPTMVTIPVGGSITVTATCTSTGAIAAAVGEVSSIATPVFGWLTVTNPAAATPGAAIETDAALRVRQGNSTALPSRTVIDAIEGGVGAVAGVLQVKVYENDTSASDSNGQPPHSIAVVADGGDAQAIAQAIALRKTPGAATMGTTSESVTSPTGNVSTICFYRPTIVDVAVAVAIDALTGYSDAIGAQIQRAVADYINSLQIGQPVRVTRLYVPANLSGSANGQTYEITALTAGVVGDSQGAADVVVGFTGLASCAPENVTITT